MKKLTDFDAAQSNSNSGSVPQHGHSNFYGRIAKLIGLTTIASLAFTFSFAQNSPNLTSTKNQMQNSNFTTNDKSKIPREEKREVREEKQSIRDLNEISKNTMDLFNTDYPKAKNVEWSVPGSFIQAEFTERNSKMEAFFNFNNELIGTAKYISYNKLPARALTEIAKKYPGYAPVSTLFYDDNENNVNNLPMPMFGNNIENGNFDMDNYYTSLSKNDKKILLEVNTDGQVNFLHFLK